MRWCPSPSIVPTETTDRDPWTVIGTVFVTKAVPITGSLDQPELLVFWLVWLTQEFSPY